MRRSLVVLFAALILTGCAHLEPAPKPKRTKIDPQRVWAVPGEGRSYVRHDLSKWPLRTLDPHRAARLARVLFPGVSIESVGDARRIDFDSERSATAFIEAARWADGMILALDTLQEQRGEPPGDSAGTVLLNLRRFLLLGTPVTLPDWKAVSRALDDESMWTASPNLAGVGALVLAGLILRGDASELARDRANQLLGRAVALRNVPSWLSWIAQLNWVRRDFRAREERP